MKNIFILLSIFISAYSCLYAISNKKDQLQRTPIGIFDMQENTLSNFQFSTVSSGMLFFNISNNKGAAFWPRNSQNQYFFGGGIWVAAKKWVTIDTIIDGDTTTQRVLKNLCEMSYNPNTGLSWMVPGRAADGDKIKTNDNYEYRVYFSTDFDLEGEPKKPIDKYNWPNWLSNGDPVMGFGHFETDVDLRDKSNYPNGPAYISDEDIFTVFKDTDTRYIDTSGYKFLKGYPLGLEFEQTTLSWGAGNNNDMIFIFYKMTNTSMDTLYDCWIAPVYDPDIARFSNAEDGATNDRIRYYTEDPALSLGVAWSRTNEGEFGYKFGYVGVSFPLTPAVDNNKRLLSSEFYLDPENQLGLKSFRNWTKDEDLKSDTARYSFVSSGQFDMLGPPGDRRLSFSTGPFDMMPGETAYFATQINFAMPFFESDPAGDAEDLQILVEKVKTGRALLYDKILDKTDLAKIYTNDFIEIFPNPVNDKAFIKYNLIGADNLIIYNLLGQVVSSMKINENNKNLFELNVEGLNTGNYLLLITNGKSVVSGKMNLVR